jgi:hypothetical protein
MVEDKLDDAEQRVLDGRTWSEFCDALKSAGDIVLDSSAPSDVFNRAEGFRYLSRLVRASLETFIEYADPAAPELRRTAHETIKMGADNPDNYYQNAPVSGRFEYRITGNRGTVHYLGLGTQAGNYGKTGTLDPTGYIDSNELETDAEGNFEITVSKDKRPGNWLSMDDETSLLVVRQTFLDRENEKLAELAIRRTDGPHAARPLTARKLDRGLGGSALLVHGCARLFQDWANGFAEHTNELPKFDPSIAQRAGGDPNIVYHHSAFKIGPSEALVIEVTPPECEYWNFQLNNYWMESLDYRYFPVTINKHSAKPDVEGRVTVVVSHRNPGVENWLDVCGHEIGTMCWRWIGAEDPPTPATRIVPLSELGA